MSSENDMVLEATDLSKDYDGVKALQGLNLRLRAGEIFCMLGANGAGKTTTINLFLGFVEPSSGSARINNMEVSTNKYETKRFLSYIPEQVMLYPKLTGAENLQFFTALTNIRMTERDCINALLGVGLSEEVAIRRVETYSKGMRQKVGIALAQAKQAQVLLLDEPTSGLDPKASNEFSQLVRKMAHGGAAVLMVTHDIFRATELANRIGIMKDGVLVDVLQTQEIGHVELERRYLQHMSN